MSHKTGFAPVKIMAFAVATNVRLGIMTSSFSPIPSAFRQQKIPFVQFETDNA